MANIATLLHNFHKANIIFRQLSPSNIYLSQENEIVFIDWTIAQKKGKTIDQKMIKILSSKSKYIRNYEKAVEANDIFSLGKIFQDIINSCAKNLNEYLINSLENLIKKMVNERELESTDLN